MGDRRMAQIQIGEGALYVYTHGHGEVFPAMARAGIKAAQRRWGDPSYATRIIVDQLTKPGRDKETGFGLMLTPSGEDAYNDDKPSIVIDLGTRTLAVTETDGTCTVIGFEDVV